jgi:hypothetical protein
MLAGVASIPHKVHTDDQMIRRKHKSVLTVTNISIPQQTVVMNYKAQSAASASVSLNHISQHAHSPEGVGEVHTIS